jgi:hypothetical protein
MCLDTLIIKLISKLEAEFRPGQAFSSYLVVGISSMFVLQVLRSWLRCCTACRT